MTRNGFVRPIVFSRAHVLAFAEWAAAASITEMWPTEIISEFELPPDTVDVLREPVNALIAKLRKAASRKRSSEGDEFKAWNLTFADAQVGAFYMPKRVFAPVTDFAPLPGDVLEAGRQLAGAMTDYFLARGGMPMNYARASELVKDYKALPSALRVTYGGLSVKKARKRIAAVDALVARAQAERGITMSVEQADVVLLFREKLPKASP